MIKWIKVTDRLPKDWQDVLIGWDKPRHNWPTGPRVVSVTFRDYNQEFPDDTGPRMFGRYAIDPSNPDRPSHWAELPAPPVGEAPALVSQGWLVTAPHGYAEFYLTEREAKKDAKVIQDSEMVELFSRGPIA